MKIETSELNVEERRAIASLNRLAKRWPKTLWLFSASGSICVMRTGSDGERVHIGEGYNQDYLVDTVNIPNDGGDW